MSQYTLQIDLVGGEKVESILQKLSGLTGALGSGGSVFGGSSGGQSPTAAASKDTAEIARHMAQGAQATSKMRSDLDKISSSGAGFNKNAAETFKNVSATFLKNNPELAARMAAAQGAMSGSAGGGARDRFKEMEEIGRHTSFSKNPSGINVAGAAAMADIKEGTKAEKLAAKELERDKMRAAREQAQQEAQSNRQSLAGSRLNIAMKMRAARDSARQTSTEAKEKERQEKMLNAQSLAGSRLNILMRSQAAAKEEKSAKDMLTFKKDMSFLMMPLFNPGSMWATLFSGRQTYSAMNTATGKAFRDSKMGGMGAGAATGLLVAGATAAGLVLKALTKTVQETVAAYEHARQIYAKALTGGMGLQFTVKRGMLASIMGVSEQDVFRFGAQMAYLNPKLEWAAQILAKTATPLTQVSWQWKILQADFSAMFAQLASDVQPAMMKFVDGLDILVKTLTAGLPALEKAANILKWTQPLYLWHRGTEALANKIYGVSQEQVDKDRAAGKMPSPQAWMKQLPASHLEKMGLQVMGGGTNYQKDISHNTKEIAAGIKMLVSMNKNKPQSSSWDTSPLTANP